MSLHQDILLGNLQTAEMDGQQCTNGSDFPGFSTAMKPYRYQQQMGAAHIGMAGPGTSPASPGNRSPTFPTYTTQNAGAAPVCDIPKRRIIKIKGSGIRQQQGANPTQNNQGLPHNQPPATDPNTYFSNSYQPAAVNLQQPSASHDNSQATHHSYHNHSHSTSCTICTLQSHDTEGELAKPSTRLTKLKIPMPRPFNTLKTAAEPSAPRNTSQPAVNRVIVPGNADLSPAPPRYSQPKPAVQGHTTPSSARAQPAAGGPRTGPLHSQAKHPTPNAKQMSGRLSAQTLKPPHRVVTSDSDDDFKVDDDDEFEIEDEEDDFDLDSNLDSDAEEIEHTACKPVRSGSHASKSTTAARKHGNRQRPAAASQYWGYKAGNKSSKAATSTKKATKAWQPSWAGAARLEFYNYTDDSLSPSLGIALGDKVGLRPYQQQSLDAICADGHAQSGVVVLPCGAGKSLLGVAAAARINKSCLVLCTNAISVDQWAQQFTHWTNIADSDIVKLVGDLPNSEKQKALSRMRKSKPVVCITTYQMVTFKGPRAAITADIMQLVSGKTWGLMLLDEVHVAPANAFKQVVQQVTVKCKLGLTATLVREDDLIQQLDHLVGPKLYEAEWQELAKAGYIAVAECAEICCELTPRFAEEYDATTPKDALRKLLCALNPNKFMMCEYLMKKHEAANDRVIVFCDELPALEYYAKALMRPFLYGNTSHKERTLILNIIRNPVGQFKTVFLSRIGDCSLDIPEANVVIQLSGHAGSRRQEGQRLGRTLRAKTTPGQGDGKVQSYFYSLVCPGTDEMQHQQKRKTYVQEELGYTFQDKTHLWKEVRVQSSLRFASLEQQQKLLAEVMAQHGRQKQAKGRKVQSQASKRAQTPTRTAEEKAFDKKRAAFFKGLGIRTC